MDIEKLFLQKEELPILGNKHNIFFQIPIHPRLLYPALSIDESIAANIFPQVADEWYESLNKYTSINPEKTGWIKDIFAKRVSKEELQNRISCMNNGLVRRFSSADGGTLYFFDQKLNYKSYASPFINFSEEKYKEFACNKNKSDILVYSQRDINTFPTALFLRNWAIKYMNEVFKQVF